MYVIFRVLPEKRYRYSDIGLKCYFIYFIVVLNYDLNKGIGKLYFNLDFILHLLFGNKFTLKKNAEKVFHRDTLDIMTKELNFLHYAYTLQQKYLVKCQLTKLKRSRRLSVQLRQADRRSSQQRRPN